MFLPVTCYLLRHILSLGGFLLNLDYHLRFDDLNYNHKPGIGYNKHGRYLNGMYMSGDHRILPPLMLPCYPTSDPYQLLHLLSMNRQTGSRYPPGIYDAQIWNVPMLRILIATKPRDMGKPKRMIQWLNTELNRGLPRFRHMVCTIYLTHIHTLMEYPIISIANVWSTYMLRRLMNVNKQYH